MYIEKTGYHMLYILYTVYFIYREKGREREREGVKAMGGGEGDYKDIILDRLASFTPLA